MQSMSLAYTSLCTINLLLQTAEQEAYDFFTSAIDGDVLDHLPLPHRATNEMRGQGVPPAAASATTAVGEGEPTAAIEEEEEEEEERDEADTSALLEQQVSLQ